SITDTLEEWFHGEAADGFNLLPDHMPGGFTDFVSLVLPDLRRRGLFRTEYSGTTLRERLRPNAKTLQ
ncbi:MAG: nitrilotriacetate monooxygenase, partial [Pseudomonadota bacterium]